MFVVDFTKSIMAVLLLLFVSMCSPGCGGEESSDETHAGRMVYVDTQTSEAMVLDVSESVPIVNPQTGRRTLMPALYCPDCRQWHAVPAMEQLNRMPGAANCRKTGTALVLEGPWPGEAGSADESQAKP